MFGGHFYPRNGLWYGFMPIFSKSTAIFNLEIGRRAPGTLKLGMSFIFTLGRVFVRAA